MSDKEPEKKLYKALFEAQKEMGVAHKSASNPFFKSKYADLPTVFAAAKGPMNNNNILISQYGGRDELGDYIETRLTHVETEEFVTSQTRIASADPNNPQKIGSGQTYARRYDLQTIAVLPTEDDDGNKGSKPPKKPVKPPVKPRPAKEIDNSDAVLAAREELSMLIDERKVPKAKQEAWLKHFKVKNLGQLTKAEVEKVIEGIEKNYPKKK